MRREIESVEKMRRHNIEDMYVLSPMQQGFLFHTVGQPRSGVYVTQSSWTLRGGLDVEGLKATWQQVVSRHAILRTAFIWEGRERPLQIVHETVAVPWVEDDWRGFDAQEQSARLKSLFVHNRLSGFDITKAPLMRLFLIGTASDAHIFIWSYHHLLLDAWSAWLVLGEVFALYEARVTGRALSLEPSRPYRDYIAWLQQQDLSKAQRYWQRALRGFTHPTRLDGDKAMAAGPAEMGEYKRQRINLPPSLRAALQEISREFQVTLNVVMQGAWTLYLAHYGGEPDVVFGVVMSGRSAQVAGVETMVGVFINTLPIRIRITPEQCLASWLKAIQRQMVTLQQLDYSPLVQVNAWADIAPGLPLFESILVFNNVPINTLLRGRANIAGLEVEQLRGDDQNNFPLTLTIAANAELNVDITYDSHRFDETSITGLQRRFGNLLRAMTTHRQSDLRQLFETIAEDDRRMRLLKSEQLRQFCLHKFRTIKPTAITFIPETSERDQ
jgi:hypothetical protein